MPDIRIDNAPHCPSLMIDGRRVLPVLYGLSDFPAARSNTAQAKRNIVHFAAASINLVSADTCLHLGWHKVSPFDTEAMRAEIAGVLDANPRARVLLRLHMNPPYWWLRDHPGECVVYRTPDGDNPGIDDGESDRLIRNDALHHLRVSLSSQIWLEEAGEKLALFCDELCGTREGDALLGIQVACGVNGEWHQWGTDVSTPMKNRFERLLREVYPTVEALRQAWHDPDVTFESANFRPETFRTGDDGYFRDPQNSQATMDAQRCIQQSVSEAILHFCRIVKAHLPGVLAGSFYGYYLGTGGNNMTISGHIDVKRLFLAKGVVDFLCGPLCYMENRKADAVPMQRALLESSRLHGMLWLTEMDQHPAGTEHIVGGDPARIDETVAVLRRNTFQPLLAGMGFWYYDHRLIPRFVPSDSRNPSAGSIYRKNGWWDSPNLMAEIAAIQKLAQDTLLATYRPAADVLLVYDTDSYYCRSKVVDAEYALHEAVARSGVAYDAIYADDLPQADLDRYRFVICVNAYRMTPERRDRFRDLLKEKTVLWLYAQGYCDGQTLAVANLAATVGMGIRKCADPDQIRSYTTCASMPEATIAIPEGHCDPLFAAYDDSAEILARYNTGEVAAARKGGDIWFAVPLITTQILRPLLQEAGTHRYGDAGDPILAGGGLVAINAAQPGQRTLTLKNGKQVTIDFPVTATAVLDAKTGERKL
jgi:hypothetical protein